VTTRLWASIFLATLAVPVFADKADVIGVDLSCDDNRVCRFDVTVRHADEGWEHYANRWEVLSPAGEILATRVLAHPHDDEQPFTRSLTDVNIPEGLSEVILRAHDLVHGYGGTERVVPIPR
jgi:hypothetical protein